MNKKFFKTMIFADKTCSSERNRKTESMTPCEAAASGPLITTVNDLVAVVTYYGLSYLFLIRRLPVQYLLRFVRCV